MLTLTLLLLGFEISGSIDGDE